ncbi:MAG: formyltransferase family protein [Balneolaceae bacterium]|nr:formyltransferase family protein [Balneolaceae bacterium]
MINAVILTSSKRGTAAHHLPILARCEHCQISAVVYNRRERADKKKFYKRKLRKALRIGPLAALNGLRMRRWYKQDLQDYLEIRPLDELCREHNVPYFETPEINCEETEDCFRKSDAEVGLSLGNGYIRESVFSIPRYGMLNIHHELLPDFQGAQSVIWQLYHGSRTSGYTIHKINRNIDGGAILYREEVPIRFEESLAETVTHTQADLHGGLGGGAGGGAGPFRGALRAGPAAGGRHKLHHPHHPAVFAYVPKLS